MEEIIMVSFKVTNIFKRSSKPRLPVPDAIWHNPLYFLAFGLGSGAMPFAPGTFGTLLAIPFYLLLRPLSLSMYIAFTVVFFILSSWLCDYVSRKIKVHDHPGMTIDEFAGFFVTMINAPHGWPWVVLGFVLFRFFDILKPWPIRMLDEHVHGGIGVVLDDIVAGLFAMIIIQLLAYL
jgi:phosphatidylglycerophosphatase A